MPFSLSPEFRARIRQAPPRPFVRWRPWQRRLFGWGVALVWLILVGSVAIYLAAVWQLPACNAPGAGLFNSDCHTTVGVALCFSALLGLYLLYLRFLVLVSQIAYIPTNDYGVDEDLESDRAEEGIDD
jgi:hypothetical protein